MKKPLHQILFNWLAYIILGFVFLGSILDGVANAVSIITPRVTYWGSALVFLIWIFLEILLKIHPITWVEGNQEKKLQKLETKHRLAIVGIILLLWVPRIIGDSQPNPNSFPSLSIEDIKQVNRDSLWSNTYSLEDEIVVNIKGKHNILINSENKYAIVAFWRLSNDFETNWHIGKRKVGGNWELAEQNLENTNSNQIWDFLIGGIECKKTYSGSIAIVLLAIPNSIIEQERKTWIDDKLGWGFTSLPNGNGIISSQVRTVETKPSITSTPTTTPTVTPTATPISEPTPISTNDFVVNLVSCQSLSSKVVCKFTIKNELVRSRIIRFYSKRFDADKNLNTIILYDGNRDLIQESGKISNLETGRDWAEATISPEGETDGEIIFLKGKELEKKILKLVRLRFSVVNEPISFSVEFNNVPVK